MLISKPSQIEGESGIKSVYNIQKAHSNRKNASLSKLTPTNSCGGGGGGELNSPSKRRLPEYPTSLVSSFHLIQLSSADRIQPDQPIFLSQSLSALRLEHLDFMTPNPNLRGEIRLSVNL